jgi:biotin carboxyl carrier protein
MNKYIYHIGICWALVYSTLVFSMPSIEIIRGKMVQGGYLIAKVQPDVSVEFLSKPVPVDPEGRFIIGFGRDHPEKDALVLLQQGKRYLYPLNIAARQWKIERIDGLPPAKVSPKSPEILQRIGREAQQIRQVRAQVSKLTFFMDTFRKPAEGRISGVYGSQRILNGEPKWPHYGQDIAAAVGSPVYAPASGTVVLAHPDMYYSGATLVIDHGYGLTSTYLHLNEIKVEVGQNVKQGELIGTIGQSGRATGPHLDWRINWLEQRLDPALFVE